MHPKQELKGIGMAETANDMNAHARTYGGFVRMFKWSVPIIFVTALLVIFLIS
jgi:hypothetical protein